MNILVCGSSDDISKEYWKANKEIFDFIFNDNDLVFGAPNSGIARLAFNVAISKERKVTSVCLEEEKNDLDLILCAKKEVVSESIEKMKKMIDKSDLLLFLPGGTSNCLDLFNALESKKNGEFDKPIIIFNLNGYLDSIKDEIEQRYIKEFANSNSKYGCVIVNSAKEVIINCMKCQMVQDSYDYKVQYKYGLFLFKDTLNEWDITSYRDMLSYFTYPLSLIEEEVNNAISYRKDTNEFYKEKCNELLNWYQKLLRTTLVCQSAVGTVEGKRRAKRVLELIKGTWK